MSSDTIAELMRQRAALQETMGARRRQIKAAAQKQRTDEKKAARAWQLTLGMTRVVIIAYVLAGHTAVPAARYLTVRARKRQWPPRSEEELQVMVEDAYLAAPIAEINSLCDLNNPLDPTAMKTAARWSEEWRLAQWARR